MVFAKDNPLNVEVVGLGADDPGNCILLGSKGRVSESRVMGNRCSSTIVGGSCGLGRWQTSLIHLGG